jgi:decaprenylphosphoryl-5-phosphoribose phosphatase
VSRSVELVGRLRRPWLTPLVRGYSRLGDNGLGWMAAGVAVGAAKGSPRLALELPAVVLAAFGLNVAVKRAVGRTRPLSGGPTPHLISSPSSSSFPSSHAATAAAGAVAIGAEAPVLVPVVAAAAVAMAASRVYLGVHHGSDIAAGLALGALTGGAYALAMR